MLITNSSRSSHFHHVKSTSSSSSSSSGPAPALIPRLVIKHIFVFHVSSFEICARKKKRRGKKTRKRGEGKWTHTWREHQVSLITRLHINSFPNISSRQVYSLLRLSGLPFFSSLLSHVSFTNSSCFRSSFTSGTPISYPMTTGEFLGDTSIPDSDSDNASN